MKKILIGCGIVSLVAFLVLVALGVFVGVQVKRGVDNWTASVEEVTALNSKHTYTPPADQSLGEERLKQYFEVRDAVLAKAQSNPTIQKLMNTAPGQNPNISLTEIVGLATSFGPEMMKTFAAELDARQMSPAEYKDMAERIYATLRSGRDAGDGDMKQIYETLDTAIAEFNIQLARNNQQQNQINFDAATSNALARHNVPALNYEILDDYRTKLTENPMLTFFELLGLAQIDLNQGQPVSGNNGVGVSLPRVENRGTQAEEAP